MTPHVVGRFFNVLFFSLILSPLPFFHASNIAHAAVQPIIGEVNWAGSSLSSADEWLELWNNSDEPLVLTGYILRGASPSDITFDETQSIPPRGTFLVANYIDTDTKSAIATSTQLVTTAISLSNTTLHIELLAPDGSMIDSTGNGTPSAGSSLPEKTSMIHQVDGSWASATTSINLKIDTTDLATPGVCDGCTSPDMETELPEPILEPIPEPETELPIIEIPSSTESNTELPTSTEPVIQPETPTSTEPVLEPLVGTSSTTEITIPTTTTIQLPIQAPIPAPSVLQTTNTAAPTMTSIAAPSLSANLRLYAIFPAPESGDEWIELLAPTGTTLAKAANWSLHDATGSIFKFTSNDSRVSVNGTIWHVPLASARLNNSGDVVELVRPDGSIAERMTYPTTAKGTRWIKSLDRMAWTQDPIPTTSASPITASTSTLIAEQITITPTEVPAPTIELPTIEPTITTQAKATTTKPATKTTKTTTKTTTKPKTSTPKIELPPPIITLDMLQQLEPEIRVTLDGVVGTVPGILGKNQFTLHTPDGRGLLVRGSSKQVSPEYGIKIRVTGTLSLNDDGLSLRMLSKDSWTKIDETESVEPRVVDLLALSQEDAWSLVQVTGTILAISSTKITLELGGFPITVKIRPVTGYRAARLSKGDVIRILGIIDTRAEEPILYPRTTTDIEIISHAKLASSDSVKGNLPAWTPFGAAGITLAVTEGYKRLRRLAKDRKYKKLAALAQ